MPKLSKKCWLDKTGEINCFLLGNQFYTHSNFHQIVCCLVSTSKGLWSFCGIICQNLFLHHNVKNSHIRNLFKKKPEQNSKGWYVNLRKYSLLSLWARWRGISPFQTLGWFCFVFAITFISSRNVWKIRAKGKGDDTLLKTFKKCIYLSCLETSIHCSFRLALWVWHEKAYIALHYLKPLCSTFQIFKHFSSLW